MNDKTYNGWTNYATWRVNLEIFDGWDSNQLDSLTMGDTYQLHKQLKDYAEEIIFEGCSYDERRPSNLMADYARAFLDDVNWHEIAEHMIEDNEE
jgi:hypothetical protein